MEMFICQFTRAFDDNAQFFSSRLLLLLVVIIISEYYLLFYIATRHEITNES